MRRRPRLLGGAVLAVAGTTLVIVYLLRSGSPGCTVPAPQPSLSPALRAIGGFDQGYSVGDVVTLEEVARRAAGALHPDLIGATPEGPLVVRAQRPGQPDAVVIPLRAQAPGATAPRLAGLVAFLLDCSGRAYLAGVEDDTSASPPLASFPPVSREQATARLQATPHLVYSSSPLQPSWADGRGQMVAAR